MTNKSMWRYSQFAQGDAIALAEWLDSDFDLAEVRKVFEAMPQEDRAAFERNNEAVIEELIRRTEGQRPAYLRRAGKNVPEATKGLAIVFAIIGQVRVRHLIDLRDRLMLIGPGSGYRVTNSRIYSLRNAFDGVLQNLSTYDWPSEVFAEYREEYSDLGDEEMEEEDETNPPKFPFR
ncbi:hypothetical protein L4P27_006049 [Pseudomonas aeruginosa]|nr:hypothetical protein [Pseudomonas aeruginosa]EKV3012223.1 hypothetical protein [Pseudomonas aeruginosa]